MRKFCCKYGKVKWLLLTISFVLFYTVTVETTSGTVSGIYKTNKGFTNMCYNDSLTLSRIIEFHFNAIVLDAHNDFLYQVYKRGADLGEYNTNTQSDIEKFWLGGVDVQFFVSWIPPEEVKNAKNYVLNQIETLKNFERKYSGKFEIAYSYDDINRIVSNGKLCGLIAIEDGVAIGSEVSNLDEFYELGVRYISITWNNTNKIASSGKDEFNNKNKSGLTEFGRKVIKRMDELGMLIDVSHLGEKSFWDIIALTKNPVIASHSNCYSLDQHYRNLKDEQIRAIAQSGGVIMINFNDDFLVKNASKIRKNTLKNSYPETLKEIYENNRNDRISFNSERLNFFDGLVESEGITVDNVIDHIDYIKNLVGIDYVGLGSDFDGGIKPPVDLYDVTCYIMLTKRMYERGYTPDEIQKVLGLNFLRVFKQVCG